MEGTAVVYLCEGNEENHRKAQADLKLRCLLHTGNVRHHWIVILLSCLSVCMYIL
jgi:hypothetical protein